MDLRIDPSLLVGQAQAESAKQKGKADNPEELRKSCEQFEAIFVQNLFKGMRATVPDGGLMPKGMTEDFVQGMMDREVAQNLSATGNLGLAEALYRQLQPGGEESDSEK